MAAFNGTKKNGSLTNWIMLGLVLGVVVGYACNRMAPNDDAARTIAGNFSILSDIFLRLIKMILAPLVFSTLVTGIASLDDNAAIGRIAVKALSWFLTASVVSLGLGMLFANLFTPGADLALPLPEAGAVSNLQTSALNFRNFITHVFPTSAIQAMAQNEILQILVFSIFFGFAVTSLPGEVAKPIVRPIAALVSVMLKITDYVMWFAPAAVFAAIASAITVQGLGVLATYGKFIGSFYVGLAVLWVLMFGAGYLLLGRSVVTLVRLLREPMMLAFSTASSESAYPKTMEQLAKFGVNERVTGFALPLGYSFNLDGSMMYQAFAALFIAQAYGIDLSFGQQALLLGVMMVTSKGMAGVARASLVVVAATIPMFNLPEAGMLLIMGVDQFLDMGRTMTNVLGNGIATAVVARWEGELNVPTTVAEEAGLPLGDGFSQANATLASPLPKESS